MPYVLPFAVFIALLAFQLYARLPEYADLALRIVVLTVVVVAVSRKVLDLRPSRPGAGILVGLAVFAIWIGPDILFPHYREHWLFQNSVMGTVHNSFSTDLRHDPLALTLRTLRAAILVPIIEELFWRGWLMRWLINPRFETVALGTWAPGSFWITAVLFASEHGPYWDVGLVAGVLYNWWMIRTKRLADCILAHAVTNLCLSLYVIGSAQWQYWP